MRETGAILVHSALAHDSATRSNQFVLIAHLKRFVYESTMDVELFVSEIQARPAIWMSKHGTHKNKVVIKRLWAEIKEKFPECTGNYFIVI